MQQRGDDIVVVTGGNSGIGTSAWNEERAI